MAFQKEPYNGRAWAKAVEQEMLEQSVNAEQDTLRYESAKSRSGDITLNQYLEAYCRKVESLRKESQISYRDMQAIKFWQRSWLAEKRSKEITSDMLIDLLDERLEKVMPATNHLYVSVLRRALDFQKRVGLFFRRFITDDLMKELWKLKLVGKSKEDDTRPTEHQVYLLYKDFLDGYNKPQGKVPYHYLMLFSIYSAFREGEICSIRYSDLDMAHGEVIIRDRKDPKKKYGNHQKVPLCPVCLEIIAMQPRIEGDDRIFPFKDVAIRSGHRTWDNLRRYTHLIHRNPPDFWTSCVRIEKEYWETNSIENCRLKRHRQGAGHAAT